MSQCFKSVFAVTDEEAKVTLSFPLVSYYSLKVT
jgi:hypothetical protein